MYTTGTGFSVYSNKLPVTYMHMEADQLLHAVVNRSMPRRSRIFH